eukprot:m.239431 g.239431  ORF g.239431 m.239431 type:complete len:424 (+) comp33745_c3_seq3:83-1354(+)
MENLDSAVLSDPSIHFVKQAAFFGRKKRRWFVLHRNSHILAYYVRPFVPPAKGEIKGIINLAEVVDVNSFGARLEIKVARGRSTFKLLADSDKIAHDWSSLIRMEAHTSGLNNPLNQNVQKACGTNTKTEDPLYTEYGGFKFADQNPELYTDYDPKSAAKGNGKVEEEENYGNFTPNTAVEGEEKELPTDGQYLEQAPPPTDSGYLDNQTAALDAEDNDDVEDNAADIATFTPTDTSVAAPNPFDDSVAVTVDVPKPDEPNPFADSVAVDTTPTTTSAPDDVAVAVENEAQVEVKATTNDADVVMTDGGDAAVDDTKTEDSAATTEETKGGDDEPTTTDDAVADAAATTTTTEDEAEEPKQEDKDEKEKEDETTTPTEQPTTEQPTTEEPSTETLETPVETPETPVDETPQAVDDTAVTTPEE